MDIFRIHNFLCVMDEGSFNKNALRTHDEPITSYHFFSNQLKQIETKRNYILKTNLGFSLPLEIKLYR